MNLKDLIFKLFRKNRQDTQIYSEFRDIIQLHKELDKIVDNIKEQLEKEQNNTKHKL